MKYEEMKEKALQELKGNDDLFVACVDELDGWNGFADGFRAYDMCELDDLHYGLSLHEFLERLTDDFHINDEYFYYSIYGLESTDDKVGLYRDNVFESDLLENLIDRENDLDLKWIDEDFAELIEKIANYTEEEEEEEQNVIAEILEATAAAIIPEKPEVVTA